MEPVRKECHVFDICKIFLQEIDDYFAENLEYITCSELYDHYAYMFQTLKEFKGNSNGFTGLSEYLIFRFIYNLLGGSFKRVPLNKDTSEFRSKDENYIIGENILVAAGSNKYRPDIVVYKNNKLVLAVEIKLYLTSGIKSLETDLNKLKEIHKHHPSAKGLFISYSPISKKGEIYKKLIGEVNSNNWLDYAILAGNNKLFKEHFSDLK